MYELHHIESWKTFRYSATSTVSSISVIIFSLILLYECHTNKVNTIIMRHTVKQ